MDPQSIPVLIRPALRSDAAAIRRLIWKAGINPTGLDWRRFTVAVAPDGELLGCGQIKPHRDGSRELASIAVWPQWRGRGVARKIIERILAENPPPLYLTCRSSLQSFYEQFHFRVLSIAEMPPYFHRIMRFVAWMRRIWSSPEPLLVMRLG